MRVMSQRERRLVAGGLLVAAIALLISGIVVPLVTGFSDREAERERLAAEYQRLDHMIGSLPRLRRQARADQDAQRKFVAIAATAEQAGVALEDRVRTTIEATGGEYRTIEHDTGSANEIRVRATARMSLSAVSRVLERLQNETPYLTVSTIGLNADAALATHKTEPLDVKLEVTVPFSPAAS